MEHDVEDAFYHSTPCPAVSQSLGMGFVSTLSHRWYPSVLLRIYVISLLTGCSSLAGLSEAYASPLVFSQTSYSTVPSSTVPTPPALFVNRSRRSTNSNVIHDEFFIPGVVASGGMVIIAILCCFMILQKQEKHAIPPGPRPFSYSARYRAPTRQLEPSEPLQPSEQPLPSEAASVNTGRYSRRQSKIQRKSMFQPQYDIDPLPQPPPSEANSYFQYKQPVPGVPQHPGLAIYNPEPLPYANGATQMRNTGPAAGANNVRNRAQDIPIPIPPPRPRPTPVPTAGRPQSPFSDQSSTQVGSENALSYLSSERANRAQDQAQFQPPPREGASSFAVPAPDPPSPPTRLPPANNQQQYQHQVSTPIPSESALSYLSSERANRAHAQAQFQPAPPEGASSFAVPALNPPSPPAQLPPANQQYQYQYQDQQQRTEAPYQQGWSNGGQPPQYTATKSSHRSRRENRGSIRGG